MSRTSSTLKRLGVGSVGVCTLLATPYLGGVANAAAPAAGTPATISIASQTTLTGSTRNDGTNQTVKISATTTPPGTGAAAVAGVRFSYQAAAGGPVVIGTDTTAPYSIEWAPSAAGTYTEIAEALDSSNTVISTNSKASVVVADVSSVHITSPAEGATIGSYGGSVIVSGTRSSDLPAIAVSAKTRDNSSGGLTNGAAVNVAQGTPASGADQTWSAVVAAPDCVNSVTAGDCDIVITAVATGTGANGTSDEVTEGKLYVQTLKNFTVVPTEATKPVDSPQTYVVTATDQNDRPVGGVTVIVTDNSATATETSNGANVPDPNSSTKGTTGTDGKFTFTGQNSAPGTATFTVQSAANGTSYVAGTDFQRTATLTTYVSTPTGLALTADPQKDLYASQSEYTATPGYPAGGAAGSGAAAGDPSTANTPVVNLCVTDQSGQPAPSGASPATNLVATVTRTVKTGTAAPVTTTTSVTPISDNRTGKTNCYVIPHAAAPTGATQSGSDTFNVYYDNNGTPGFQSGSSDVAAPVLTLNFATLGITTTNTQAQQGTAAAVAFKVAGADGSPFAGRKIALSLAGTDANFPTTQPAGTTRTGAGAAVCVTDASGVCNVTLNDPTAGSDSVTATDSITDATTKQIATPAQATSTVEYRTQSVNLANVDQTSWDTQTITPFGSDWVPWMNTPQPGDAVQVVYQLSDVNGDPLRGITTTLSLDHGFFTPNCSTTDYKTCTFSPAIADGAPVGNLKNDGKTKTVTSDNNGQVTVTIGIARDAGFDDDGRVSVSVTVASNNGTVVNGDANNNTGTAWFRAFTTDGGNSGKDPYNGATVKILPNSSTDKLSGDVALNNGTRFYIEATDQFGNLVRTNGCDITVTASGNGQINDGWCSNNTTPGSYTNSRHPLRLSSSTAGTFAGEPSTVTATWVTPATTFKASTPATTPPTYNVNTTSVNKTDSFTVNLYAIDQQNLQYSFASTPGNTVPVNTAVTTSVTVKDQKGNPVQGLDVRFIRSGPSDAAGNAQTGNWYTPTNNVGKAGYSFTSGAPGTATLTVILTDDSGNELSRGVQNVTFTKGTPTTTKPTFSLATNVISAGQTDRLVVRGTPGQTVEVLAYSLPNTTYKVVRTGTLSSAGTKVFYVAPATNSRIYVRSTAGQAASQHITVKSALTLAASAKGRVGTFTGKVSPAVVGRTVTIYYIKGGKSVAAGSAKVAKGGTYTFSRTFAAPGQKISFFAQTTKDSLNASGRSLTRQITFGR